MDKDEIKERPYEYLFRMHIANLPLSNEFRDDFRRTWDAVNRVYDKEEEKV